MTVIYILPITIMVTTTSTTTATTATTQAASAAAAAATTTVVVANCYYCRTIPNKLGPIRTVIKLIVRSVFWNVFFRRRGYDMKFVRIAGSVARGQDRSKLLHGGNGDRRRPQAYLWLILTVVGLSV